MDEPDSERFTRLYEAHHDRVLAYVRSRVPPEHADDVVAETFIVAWRRLQDVPGHALPWLLVVARNTLAHQGRSTYRRDVLAAEVARLNQAATEPDIGDDVAERLALLSALTAMSDAEREALLLTAWDGLSARDAAVVAGCSAAAFTVRLHRARRRLARQVNGAPAPPRPSLHPSRTRPALETP